MKKFLFTLIAISIFIPSALADGEKEKVGRVKEMMEFKMKYLAQEIDLKQDQQKKFFELYDEMEIERRNCYKDAFELRKKLDDTKDATDADYQKVTDAFNEANLKAAEIEKRYDEKFSKFLSPKQIFKMKESEREFRQKMEKMKNDKKRKKSPSPIKNLKGK